VVQADGDLRSRAQRFLWPHFTRAAAWRDNRLPVLVRGEGCHVFDDSGFRYLDGLAGLFCVALGHGRADLISAATTQMQRLAYATNWGTAHPSAIEAAERIADLAPGDLSVTFFVNSGSEANESAIKFCRQYHRSQGQPDRRVIISRSMAYHGTTLGALSVTGLPRLQEPFLPLLGDVRHVPNTLGYTGDCGPASELECVKAVEQAILEEGPERVAAVFAEPVQNSRGALVPPDGYWAELRRICDAYGLLLVADEVICGFGRLGHWFGSQKFGVVPDLLTFAKASTSGYAPLGGMVARAGLVQELFDSPSGGTFTHGATWGGHPVATAVSVATMQAIEDEKVLDNVRALEPALRADLDRVAAGHRCVKEVRGTGFFYAVELMANRESGREFTGDEEARVLQEVLPAAFRRTGVILRGDDRGGTMIMISPPLIADRDVLDELVLGLDAMLDDVEAAIAA
jgi:adenosylmethionine-8-amino-7-oxononanoate aminotransferase